MTDLSTQPFGVYIHVPFCVSKCPYCDFASEAIAPGCGERVLEAYASSVAREVELACARFPEFRDRAMRSVYLGGGTPSLLDAGVVSRWLGALRAAFPRTSATSYPDFEVTLECNPVAAEVSGLGAMRDAGVNRISLGVQSFSDDSLRRLGRAHSADDARRAVDAIRAIGFASWGLDLIFAVPGTGCDDLRRDLGEAVRYSPPHLSVYGLTLHEGTPMFDWLRRGDLAAVEEETQREMFLAARGFLRSAGYVHYEISNYALAGHEGRHNGLYWRGSEYLGLGASAHGYVGGARYANAVSPEEYAGLVGAGIWPGVWEEAPTERSRRGEQAMLALRCLEGVDMRELGRRMGCDAGLEYGVEIRGLVEAGLLERQSGRIRLSEEGMLLSDTVFEAFF